MTEPFSIPKEFSLEWLAQVGFDRTLRGYSPDQVDQTIDFVVKKTAALMKTYNDTREQLNELRNSVKANNSRLSDADLLRLEKIGALSRQSESEDNDVFGDPNDIRLQEANENIDSLTREIARLKSERGPDTSEDLLKELNTKVEQLTERAELSDKQAQDRENLRAAAVAERDKVLEEMNSLKAELAGLRANDDPAEISKRAFGIIENATALGERTVSEARTQSEAILREANEKATQSTAQASEEARVIVDNARNESFRIKGEADESLRDIRGKIAQLEESRKKALEEMSSIAEGLAEIIDHHDEERTSRHGKE